MSKSTSQDFTIPLPGQSKTPDTLSRKSYNPDLEDDDDDEEEPINPIKSTFNSTNESKSVKFATSFESKIQDVPVDCEEYHVDRRINSCRFSLSVDDLFSLLFTNSKFFVEFHERNKTANFTATDWILNPETGMKERNLTFNIALNQEVGPKMTQITENQVIISSKAGLLHSINIESNSDGIPYSDSFYVTLHYCLTRVSEGESKMRVFASIRYRKPLWNMIKGFIEKNVWAGLKEYFDVLNKAIQDESYGFEYMPKTASGLEKGQTTSDSLLRRQSQIPLGENLSVINYIILGMIVILLCLNMMLFHRIMKFEPPQQKSELGTLPSAQSSPVSKMGNEDDWLQILKSQENLRMSEAYYWHKLLNSCIKLLNHIADSLIDFHRVVADVDKIKNR